MTGLAVVLMLIGAVLFFVEPISGGAVLLSAFACVAVDNHNHDEGR